MRFEDTNIPNRKSKPKPNLLENHEPFLRLRSLILSHKMTPYQQVGLWFKPEDVSNLGVKAPWRMATDSLRRLLRKVGLASDYEVVKYQTDTPGVWFVRVTYTPGDLRAPARKRGRPRKTTLELETTPETGI